MNHTEFRSYRMSTLYQGTGDSPPPDSGPSLAETSEAGSAARTGPGTSGVSGTTLDNIPAAAALPRTVADPDIEFSIAAGRGANSFNFPENGAVPTGSTQSLPNSAFPHHPGVGINHPGPDASQVMSIRDDPPTDGAIRDLFLARFNWTRTRGGAIS